MLDHNHCLIYSQATRFSGLLVNGIFFCPFSNMTTSTATYTRFILPTPPTLSVLIESLSRLFDPLNNSTLPNILGIQEATVGIVSQHTCRTVFTCPTMCDALRQIVLGEVVFAPSNPLSQHTTSIGSFISDPSGSDIQTGCPYPLCLICSKARFFTVV
jgi:hypothetical protein